MNISTKNKKQALIFKLVDDDIDSIQQNLLNQDVYWLGQILENGFCGYKNQTIKELTQEANERGLLEI